MHPFSCLLVREFWLSIFLPILGTFRLLNVAKLDVKYFIVFIGIFLIPKDFKTFLKKCVYIVLYVSSLDRSLLGMSVSLFP